MQASLLRTKTYLPGVFDPGSPRDTIARSIEQTLRMMLSTTFLESEFDGGKGHFTRHRPADKKIYDNNGTYGYHPRPYNESEQTGRRCTGDEARHDIGAKNNSIVLLTSSFRGHQSVTMFVARWGLGQRYLLH